MLPICNTGELPKTKTGAYNNKKGTRGNLTPSLLIYHNIKEYTIMETKMATQITTTRDYKIADLAIGAVSPTQETTGRAALMRQLEALGYAPGEALILKLGDTRAWVAKVNKNFDDVEITGTRIRYDDAGKKILDERGVTQRELTETHVNGFAALSGMSRRAAEQGRPSGVFIVPNRTEGLAAIELKEIKAAFYEIDGASLEDQEEKVKEIQRRFGLTPSCVVFSGSKSLHVYYTLIGGCTIEQWKELQYSLIMLTGGDPAIVAPNRVMRAAGFFRHDKGKHQALVYSSDWVYSAREIADALSPVLPHGCSYRRFSAYRRDKGSPTVFTQPEEEFIVQAVDERHESLCATERQSIEERGGVPLIYLLPGRDREIIRNGSEPGERRNDQYKLVMNLATTVKFCIDHGVKFSGGAWELAKAHLDHSPDPTGEVAAELARQWELRFTQGRIEGKSTPIPYPQLLARVENWLTDEGAIAPDTFDERVKAIHHELTDVTPFVTQTINQRFLDTDTFIKFGAGVHFVKTPTGTGKTTAARELVKVTQSGNVISYRNSLCRQFCNTTGVKFVWGEGEDLDQLKTQWGQDTWTACSVESIGKFPAKKYLVVEEASKVIETMLTSSTCLRDRRAIITKFLEMVRAAEVVILLDADIRATDIEYIKAIAPEKPLNLLFNNYIFSDYWRCHFHTDPAHPNSKNPIEELIFSSVEAGENLLVVADSRRELRKVALKVEEYGLTPSQILIVDSEAMLERDPRVVAFLEDPAEFIEVSRCKLVLLSPTAEASVSIDIHGYFSKVVGIFSGVVHHLSARQMLARLRDNSVPRHIHIVERGRNREGSTSVLPDVIRRSQFEKYEISSGVLANAGLLEQESSPEFLANIVESLNFGSARWYNPQVEAWARYKAQTNYSLKNLGVLLRESLIEFGHEIIEVHEEKIEMNLKSQTEFLNNQEAARIADSDDVDLSTASKNKSRPRAGLKEEYEYRKALIKSRVPGVDLTPAFVLEFHVKNPEIIPSLERRAMIDLCHREGVFKKEMKRFIRATNNGSILDFKSAAPMIELADKFNLSAMVEGLIKRGEIWDKNTKWVKDFFKLSMRNRALIRAAFGINLHANYEPCNYISRLLKKFGYEVKSQRLRVDGVLVNRYGVDTDAETEATGAIYTAITLRLEQEYTAQIERDSKVDGVKLNKTWVEELSAVAV